MKAEAFCFWFLKLKEAVEIQKSVYYEKMYFLKYNIILNEN
jgi:hypothetical protein